jgi:DNA-binding NarL/FixJ family response regulator
MVVVGSAATGEQAIELCRSRRIDVVLMDIRMPGLDGIAATRAIGDLPDPPRVLVLTTFGLDEYVTEAIRAGAAGFLLKDESADTLVDAVRAVATGDAALSPAVTRIVVDQARRATQPVAPREVPGVAELTERERDVLVQLTMGRSNAEIADALYLDLIGTALLGFAAVTLFVSTFVIANTFAVLVGQQRRQLGLLRAVGATSRQTMVMVLAEAGLVGAVASGVGLGAGVLVAEGIKALFEAVTTGGFPEGPTRILLRTVLLATTVGVGVTVVSALTPARRAGRVTPLEAMRSESVGVVTPTPIAGATGPLAPDEALMVESFAADHGLEVGDRVPVTFSDDTVVDLELAAVIREVNPVDAKILVDRSLVAAHARNVDAQFGAVRFARGVAPEEGMDAVGTVLADFPQIEAKTIAEHLEGREQQAQQVLTMANGLLVLTIVVALTGIANTIVLSALERRSEFGLLRAVGMTTRQVRTMVRYEAVLPARRVAKLDILTALEPT